MSNITIKLGQEIQSLPGDFQAQLAAAFAGMANLADEWLGKANAIEVNSEADTDAMKLARASRLELRQIRIKAEKARKELKAGYLAGGRAVDAVANVINRAIDPIEDVLLEKEEFIERKAAAEKMARFAERRNELQRVGVNPLLYLTQTDEFDDALWAAFVQGQVDAIEARKKRAADEAAASEAEAKRVDELRAENDRLRAEKEAAEKAARLAQYRSQQEAMVAKAKADAETNRIAAENARIVAEERRIAEDARRELARVEFEKAQAVKRELMAKEAAEMAEQAARHAAEKAPDIEKLKAYINALVAIPVPTAIDEVIANNIKVVREKVLEFKGRADKL